MTREMTVKFFNRDFSERVSYPWSYVDVKEYSRAAEGGPKQAILTFYGNRMAIWELANMMRCPVVIRDRVTGKKRWWGVIYDGVIYDPDSQTSFDLGAMSNKLAIQYVEKKDSQQTAWEQDDDSVNEYGQKDLLLMLRESTASQAEAKRTKELNDRKYPQIGEPIGKSGDKVFAEIECKGIWDTIDWQYYAHAAGLEQYIDDDSWYGREVGEDRRPICAQGFQLTSAAGWDIVSIWIKVRKYGSPTANLIVSLYSESGGLPNAQLATKTLAHGNFTSSMQWVEFVMGTPYSASTGTTYFIHVEKAGAIDADNCYIVDGNESRGYPNGDFFLYWTDLTKWKEKTTMNMLFKVMDAISTTSQIETLISNASEFLLDTDIIDVSGINTNQYREGLTTALFELRELLNIGTSNNLRLLATVLQNLHLKVYEAPVKYEKDYSIDQHGVLRDHNDTIIPNSACPAGVWIKTNNLIPANVDLSRLSAPSHRFIEQAKYTPATDQYLITATGVTKGIGEDQKDMDAGIVGRFLRKFGGIRRG